MLRHTEYDLYNTLVGNKKHLAVSKHSPAKHGIINTVILELMMHKSMEIDEQGEWFPYSVNDLVNDSGLAPTTVRRIIRYWIDNGVLEQKDTRWGNANNCRLFRIR